MALKLYVVLSTGASFFNDLAIQGEKERWIVQNHQKKTICLTVGGEKEARVH
jgi:hypothetical protein